MQIESLNSSTKYFVPLGAGLWFAKRGIPQERIVELDWWSSAELGGLSTRFAMLTKDVVPATKTNGRLRTLLNRLKRRKAGEDGYDTENSGDPKSGLKVELEAEVGSPIVPTLSTAGTRGFAEVGLSTPLDSGDIAVTGPTVRMSKTGGALEHDDLAITSVDPMLADLVKMTKDDLETDASFSRAFMTITCAPAHHNTGRSLLLSDKVRSKPATWIIQVSGTKHDFEGKMMFFGGDSGYQGADGKKTQLYQGMF